MSKPSVRLKELDGMRGIAALMVVLYHFTTLFFEEFKYEKFPYQLAFGHFGVQFFFVLSGFVIFMTAQDGIKPIEFIKRRVVRLYPAYWICLIFTFLTVSIFGLTPGRETKLWEALVGLSMLQGLFGISNVDLSYWSLRPELVFYFFIFLLIVFKWQRILNYIMIALVFGLLIDFYMPLPLIISRALNIPFLGYFFSGIVFYRLKFIGKSTTDYLLLTLMLFVNIFISKHAQSWLFIPLIYFLFLLFVFDKVRFLDNKVLHFLGFISYPLYLIHQNIGLVFINKMVIYFPNMYFGVILLMAVMLVVVLASVVAYWLEPMVREQLRTLLFSRKFCKFVG